MAHFLDCAIARIIAFCLIGIGIPVFVTLLFLPAWYGRYAKNCKMLFGSVPARTAWILQECPSFLIPFVSLFFHGDQLKSNYVNVVCLAFYMFH